MSVRYVARFVALVGSAMKAGLIALLSAPKLVWDGTKFVLQALSPPQQAAQAETALVTQVEELVAETEAKAEMTSAGIHKADVPADFHADLGRAAVQYLADAEHEDPSLASLLDEEMRDYLLHLPRDRQSLLVAYRPAQIGMHLSGDIPLVNMPRIPSFREWQQAQHDRLVAQGLRPDPRAIRTVRLADVDETPDADTVRFGMR